MAREIRIPTGLNISLGEGEKEKEGAVVPRGSMSSRVDSSQEIEAEGTAVASVQEGKTGKETEQSPIVSQKERVRKVSSSRRDGRSTKDGVVIGQRILISKGLYLVMNLEKSQRLMEDGEFMSFGEFVAEAVSFYLKKTRKEAYEEYKSKGWLK